MESTDQDLVAQVSQRQAPAFELLFNRYGEWVCAHLRRIVRDSSTADDLSQEVFLLLWNRAEQWHGQGPFKAWLLRIATNLALNHLRAVHRRREQPLDLPLGTDTEEETPVPAWMADASALGPDALFEETERQERLHRLIEELPEDKREVFRLIHDAQMEIREVARQLDIPEGTVKSRLHHARRRIARQWQDLENG
jgi:RNA polymerase sigma-70 factor (ECF subfamily)